MSDTDFNRNQKDLCICCKHMENGSLEGWECCKAVNREFYGTQSTDSGNKYSLYLPNTKYDKSTLIKHGPHSLCKDVNPFDHCQLYEPCRVAKVCDWVEKKLKL